ncbi:cell envelope integrity protein TolA [Micromonospora sp. NPDC051300]|uniref:cell envelope integrity protein TolA n=1 Tax=Micromonospora sp. NPDC051300 TaxID=3364286 RepID=UPI0037B3102A
MTQAAEDRHLTVLPGGGDTESAKAKAAREVQERHLARQKEKEEKAALAEKQRQQIEARRKQVAADPRPHIELGTDPESIRALTRAIDTRALPDTYVRAGAVVVVETPSGAIEDDDEPAQIISAVDPTRLSRILADATYTYELEKRKLADGTVEFLEVESTPKQHLAAAALSSARWNGLPVLHGIVTTPLFRPDGTLIQEPGYDEATKVIYAPKLNIARVPDQPTAEQIDAAKAFILGKLLANFPWVSCSRANYIGALVAPLVRHYLGGVLVPLIAIDAASPGTGKSLLALIMTKAHSGHIRPWVSDDVELRKAITSILVDSGGAVVCLDNVGKGETVDQPCLSSMLTASAWSDRLLGASTSVKVPNDRVWMVTGNNLSIGGDNPSRTVPVKVDARTPNPDMRPSSEFALGDLEEWLTDPAHRAEVLHHLLVLVRGWIVAGANRIETPMRTFTPWASATAGFLDWMGETGFMTNRDTLLEVDEEEAQYGAFYAQWDHLHGDKRLTARELHDSAMPDVKLPFDQRDKWNGAFLVRKKDGQIPSVGGLGKMLAAEIGRYRGGFRLNGFFNAKTKVWTYSVIKDGEQIPEDAR